MNMTAKNASDIDITQPEWLSLLRREIEDIPFLPVHGHGTELLFKKIREVFILPKSKETTPADANILFGRYVLNRDLVDDDFVNFMLFSKLLDPLDVNALLADWQQNGLQRWWTESSGARAFYSLHFDTFDFTSLNL
jgi:hypothetical protein